ncbi:hypothetical protein HU200_029313 [Digitaria exilis]|uniref:DUF4220 domain-containing protein n=1 Tax=Digitaria exilis TaxID=1010633 RepID=A0A835BTD0_9POAL|nr:hypothetical protein HU200_029313 [Digitaria exilis]
MDGPGGTSNSGSRSLRWVAARRGRRLQLPTVRPSLPVVCSYRRPPPGSRKGEAAAGGTGGRGATEAGEGYPISVDIRRAQAVAGGQRSELRGKRLARSLPDPLPSLVASHSSRFLLPHLLISLSLPSSPSGVQPLAPPASSMSSPIPSPIISRRTMLDAAMDPPMRATIFVAVVTIHALLLIRLGSRRRCSRHRALRLVLWSLSAAYLPVMSYVLSYMTSNLWTLESYYQLWLLVSLVLVQSFLKARADMEALAVASIASPVAGDDDINSLKVRPSMESIIYSFWVAGLVIYKFVAFHRATGSFALGRNVQLIHGYMTQLQEAADCLGRAGDPVASEPLLVPQLKDLCLSFALFKCLRRRFAGYPLAEAGSSWAFRGRDDHERIFRVIASELTFASDFYYSPLPVASLGSRNAGIHFFLSALIFCCLCLLVLYLITLIVCVYIVDEILEAISGGPLDDTQAFYIVPMLPVFLGLVIAWMEMSEMLASVRSNWTKISIVGHYIRCHNRLLRRIFTCLLGRCKAPKQWKDKIGQVDLLTNASLLAGNNRLSCARLLFIIKGRRSPLIKVPLAAKAAIITSFRSNGRQLSAGTAAVKRRRQAFCHDITWACLGGDVVTTTSDAILVWCVATALLEKRRCSSKQQQAINSMGVAVCLSRYCVYLVAKVPCLLPDNSAWTKRRYQEVKESVKAAALLRTGGHDTEAGAYGQLLDSFGCEGSHEVLKRGSMLAKQLVDEGEKQRSSEEGDDAAGAEGGGEDAVWELLAEFWSEMLLYVAPSDNVKGHIEALQHGGELITLLWALLLHSGITSRPARNHVPQA